MGIARSISGELVVETRLVELFNRNALKGAVFHPVREQRRQSRSIPRWFEPRFTSNLIEVVEPTKAGNGLIDDTCELPSIDLPALIPAIAESNDASWCDKTGQYRCPLGHTVGLNLLSELSIEKNCIRNVDIGLTRQHIGVRRGLLRPESMIVISPELCQLLIDSHLTGVDFEIVHLIPNGQPV